MSNNRIAVDDAKAVPDIKRALDKFKYEVADEVGIDVPHDGYWGDITSRDCGKVGGNMVKRMIQMAEKQLIGRQ